MSQRPSLRLPMKGRCGKQSSGINLMCAPHNMCQAFTAERYCLSVPHWVSFSLITLVELHRSNPVDLVLRLSLLHSQSTFLVLDIQWLKAHQTSNSNHCNVSVQKGGCFLHREGHLRSSRNVVAFGVAISWEHPHVYTSPVSIKP